MHQEMYVKALTLYLLTWITAAYQPLNFSEMKPNSGGSAPFFFPIIGNVYPLGLYTVTIKIGNSPKQYVLDIDTGSDLTWVQSSGQGDVVPCSDLACKALGINCIPPNSPCQYKTRYADGSSYTGTLYRDSFPLGNGKSIAPKLTFGCGTPKKDGHGVLGLGNGEPGILKQLTKQGLIRNVVGHCLSRQGGGFLFLGDYSPPGLRIVWKHISKSAQHYSLGKANILMDNHVTDIKGLNIIFDSGSTYTYLASQAYGALLDLVTRNVNKLKLKRANDNTLPYCWQRPSDDAKYFFPLALDFTDEKNVRFELPLKSYLITTKNGNVCLGILNGTQIGLKDMNVIGDISMQDKLVIYDNEKEMVGWASVTTCKINP
ncbi:hypothetical protein CASFOL_016215 [Castilleja foliolosa]|uniref:Peptidase A1 domain-containing protein n=1 Tax=Castilleja foliolosa TaxID=1961234 RepID=A0ABD3DGS1_9LAMI